MEYQRKHGKSIEEEKLINPFKQEQQEENTCHEEDAISLEYEDEEVAVE